MSKYDPHFADEVKSHAVENIKIVSVPVEEESATSAQPVVTIDDDKLPSPCLLAEGLPDGERSDASPKEDLLLATQLLRSTPDCNLQAESANEVVMGNVFDLYRAMAPRNALESVLVRHIVALSNAGMECYAKLTESHDLMARALNLKFGMKSSELVAALIERLAKIRGEIEPGVSIGNVNVEAGGQAIVGKVAVGDRTMIESPARPTPQLLKSDE